MVQAHSASGKRAMSGEQFMDKKRREKVRALIEKYIEQRKNAVPAPTQ